MSVGLLVSATLKPVGETCVIHAEQVEQRGVEVVHMDRIARHVETEFVRFSVHEAALDSAAGELWLQDGGRDVTFSTTAVMEHSARL